MIVAVAMKSGKLVVGDSRIPDNKITCFDRRSILATQPFLPRIHLSPYHTIHNGTSRSGRNTVRAMAATSEFHVQSIVHAIFESPSRSLLYFRPGRRPP